MRLIKIYILAGLLWMLCYFISKGQNNSFSQYFTSGSSVNPALAGDTRFGQIQLLERLQTTVSSVPITNTLLSYDQKIPNHHSGINIAYQRRTAGYNEQKIKLSYSYTVVLKRKYWIKGGFGVSGNSLDTKAREYQYPDQYNTYGYTGSPTNEEFPFEKETYPAFSAGLAFYTEYTWISAGADNLNAPRIGILDEDYRAPIVLHAAWGAIIPLNKRQHSRRMFSAMGGLNPYSSIGPEVLYYRNGNYQLLQIGINGFTRPLFWGVKFRNNAYLGNKQARNNSLNLMAGYRAELFSIAYSYDFMLNRIPTNTKGVHEISLGYYFFAGREDYKKNKLVPLVNQLMY